MTEICFTKKVNTLDEIIGNTAELPIESQYQILMMAKAMQHTRNYMLGHSTEKYMVHKGSNREDTEK